MKVIVQLRTAARALSVTTNHLFLIFFLCLALPALASAQDPLAPSYLPAISTNCANYPSNIWVTDSLAKVYQNSGNVGACPSATGNKWITIHGTQNEIVDFQVHFHDSGSGTSGYEVTVSSFVQTSPGSFTIPAPSSSARDIVVYREAYVPVTASSQGGQGSTAAYNWNGIPTGNIPDILIPAIDPYYHQTTNAFPFTIAAGHNQSVWVDIHIPPTAPSGYYKGTVTLQTDCPGSCTTLTTLPIILAVWEWPGAGSMPSTATLRGYHIMGDASACSAFYNTGYGSACGAWPGAGGSAGNAAAIAYRDAQSLYLDHRLQLASQLTSAPTGTNWNTYAVPSLNGTANTILPGAKINSYTFSSDSGSLQSWATVFNTGGWFNTTFQYNCDEPPNGCGGGVAGWKNLWSQGQNDKTTTPVMPSLSTTSLSRLANGNGSGQSEATMCTGGFNGAIAAQPSDCLKNSIDIMVVQVVDMDQSTGGFHRSDYNSWLAAKSYYGTNPPSRQLWSYLACDSTGCGGGSTGNEAQSWSLDITPVANRENEWASFLNQQSGELYFQDTICWGTSSGGSCGSGDPWQGVRYAGSNGDGTLMYPGRQIGTPTGFSNVGVTNPIFLPSLRLKLIRDGYQDYEILNVLHNNGKGSVATAAINSFITNNGTNVGFPFNNTLAPAGPYTSDLPDARMTIGTAMHQLTYSVALVPPPTLTGTLQ